MSINGETIDGASIGGGAALDAEAYDLWLRKPDPDVAHLVEIDYRGNSAVYPNWLTYTLKLSDLALPGSGYRDRVKSIPSFQRQIGERFTGTVTGSVGSIELHNEDGALDLWHNLAVDGQEVRVYQGDPSWAIERYRLVYKCVAEMFSASSMEVLTLQLRGIDYKADQPIQTNLIPNTGTTATANLPIPKALGAFFNASPAVLDVVNQVYQVNDGAITGLSAARDGGIPFQTPQIAISAVVGNLISFGSAHGFIVNTRVRFDIGSFPSSADWYGIAWSGTVFCAIATGGTIAATSPDGITWTQRVLPVSANWQAVAWSGTVFCAIATGGTIAATSPDGITWTQRVLPVSDSWQDITWSGSVFCAVAVFSSVALTSPDGITWTQRAMPVSSSWICICWTGLVFCAIASGTTIAATSPDGITWTQRVLPVVADWSGIAWSGAVLCIVASSSTIAATSPDGITWTQRVLPSSVIWAAIRWNGTVFCAIAYNSTVAATSYDGITWTARTLPTTSRWHSMAWNGSVLCVPGDTTIVTTSADGITWSPVAGALPAPLVAGTDYWVSADGLTTVAVKLCATRGGTVVALSNTTAGAGVVGFHWTADLATGKLYLDSKPAGVLTVDGVAGSTDAASMIITALGATDVDPNSKIRFQSTCPQTLGIFIKDRRNKIDVAQEIVAGISAWYGCGRDALLLFGRVEASPAYAYADLTEDEMITPLVIDGLIKPEKMHRIGYRPNNTNQDNGLFAGVTAENRVLYTNDYSASMPIAGTDTGANGSFHALAITPDVIPSLMALSSDAQTEAARLDALYFGWGATFACEVGLVGTLFDIGQVINIHHSRYGIGGTSTPGSGTNMTLISVEDKPTEKTVALRFFAALPTYAPGQL